MKGTDGAATLRDVDLKAATCNIQATNSTFVSIKETTFDWKLEDAAETPAL